MIGGAEHFGMPARLLMVVVAGLAVSGCEQLADGLSATGLPIQNWRDQPPAKEVSIVPKQYRHDVAFSGASTGLSDAAGQSLVAFLNGLQTSRQDSVVVVLPAGDGILARRRGDAVATALAAAGVQGRLQRGDGLDPPLSAGSVAVMVERNVVVLPACPDWSQMPNNTFSNGPTRSLGCATAVNFGMMVADPTDIVRGRDGGPGDGTALAISVDRYRKDKTKPLLNDSATAEIIGTPGGE